MQTIQVYYISLSGNTTSFLERLDRYLQKEFQESLNYINVKDLVKSGEPSTFKILKGGMVLIRGMLKF